MRFKVSKFDGLNTEGFTQLLGFEFVKNKCFKKFGYHSVTIFSLPSLFKFGCPQSYHSYFFLLFSQTYIAGESHISKFWGFFFFFLFQPEYRFICLLCQEIISTYQYWAEEWRESHTPAHRQTKVAKTNCDFQVLMSKHYEEVSSSFLKLLENVPCKGK